MCGCDSFPVCGGAGLAPVYNAQPEWPYRTEGVKASSGFWGWSVVAVLALACRRGGGLLGVWLCCSLECSYFLYLKKKIFSERITMFTLEGMALPWSMPCHTAAGIWVTPPRYIPTMHRTWKHNGGFICSTVSCRQMSHLLSQGMEPALLSSSTPGGAPVIGSSGTYTEHNGMFSDNL